MDKIENLHHVSRLYFFILALAYAGMALAFRSDLLAGFFLTWMRILDVPFAFVSLLYGGSTLALQINQGRSVEDGISPWVLVIFTGGLLLFAAVIFVNFAFPSQL